MSSKFFKRYLEASRAAPAASAALTKARLSVPAVTLTEDLKRIISLPRRTAPSDLDALVREETELYVVPNVACKCVALGGRCVTSLFPTQAWALREMRECGGLVGDIPVGGGKTLLDMLAAAAVPNVKTAVLFVPANLVPQLEREWDIYAQHWRLPNRKGGRYFTSGRPVVQVCSYERFSRPEQAHFLEELKPDLFIWDEAHAMRAPPQTSARTSRAAAFFRKFPQTRLVLWTGTLTTRSVRDYQRLCGWALGAESPAPLDYVTTEQVAGAVDPSPRSGFSLAPGALKALCGPSESVREGWRRRLRESPGYVTSLGGGEEVPAALYLKQRTPPSTPLEVKNALVKMQGLEGAANLNRAAQVEAKLRALQQGRSLDEFERAATWVRPDGEQLVSALEVAKCTSQLSLGFFYRWRFPRGEDAELVARWREARSNWTRELREQVRRRLPGMDSPALCTNAARRYMLGEDSPLPKWEAETYAAWAEVEPLVKPALEESWLSDWIVDDAAEWAKETKGVVWCVHSAFGRRLAKRHGIPYYGQGDSVPVNLNPTKAMKAAQEEMASALKTKGENWRDDANHWISCETGERGVAASVWAHGTGKNLQRAFSQCLFAGGLVDAGRWEQALGRFHRPGQTADEVSAYVYQHTESLRDAFDSAIAFAQYVSEGAHRHRLIKATRLF